MHSEDLEYRFEGTTYVGHMATPDGDSIRPAVLVCHEGPGLTEHPKWRARRLAEEFGYVAFALDYWGGGRPLAPDEIATRMRPAIAEPCTIRPVARAGLEQLLAHPRADHTRVGAIGYCFGGSTALELARDGAPIHAVVGFHSGLAHTRPQDCAAIVGRVLVCLGSDDPIISAAQREQFVGEMTAAGVDWQMHLYGGAGHSFTNRNADGTNPGFQYHASSDARSWTAMAAHFADVFGTP